MNFSIPTDIPDHIRRELITASQRSWDTRPRWRIIGDAISQLANSCLPGGAADESLSGRSYRIVMLEAAPPMRWRIVRWCAEALFWPWDRGNHTQLAFWEDVYRARARGTAAELIGRAVELQTWGEKCSLRDATANSAQQE